jgi:hypothetical protein
MPANPSGTPPELLYVTHHTNFGFNFQTRRDEYVTIAFRTEGKWRIDDIYPEVGGYGVRPIHLDNKKDFSEAQFKLPPGLTPGWHNVTIRVGSSPPSNPQRVAVDFPEPTVPASITGASDGTTWRPNELNLSRGNVLSVWVACLPENADRANVRATLAGQRLSVVYIEVEVGKPARQINLQVLEGAPVGELALEVNGSAPVPIQVFR